MLNDVTGFRGEKMVELCLTDFQAFPSPLFRPGFLGDKWPAVDFYVELATAQGQGMYFLGQAKSSSKGLSNRARVLSISTKARDIQRLLQIPAPTYIFGVHEPTQRVFARSVHSGGANTISSIPLTHVLNAVNLQQLHDEVVSHWQAQTASKPTTSAFA